MEHIDQDLVIKSIIAVPRSKNFYNFYINDTNEKRSMKLEALMEFIINLCPVVGGKARLMIYELRAFYVEIETETILELAETVGEPESRHSILFGSTKKVIKEVKENKERQNNMVGKPKQVIFGNILKLARKS